MTRGFGRKVGGTGFVFFVALTVLLGSSLNADAAKRRVKHVAVRPAATMPEKDAALVLDATSGHVLFERNADAIRYPASLTKMMTLYLLFDALDKGTIAMDTPMAVSKHAAAQAPTKMYLAPGQTIPVETAIKAIVIRSANDVAVVISEALGGTEDHFAEMMTEKAHQLGMLHTNFHNASGLPDKLQLTTANDLSLLARHVAYDFPQYYHYFSLDGFTYKGRVYQTHDNLIGAFKGTDGIKTGYTQMSGFNLVSSVVRDGRHIIGVVMGGRTAVSRDQEMMRLLSTAFDRAKQEPMLVAQANVPWLPGAGPKTHPVWNAPTPASVMVASLESSTSTGAASTAVLAAATSKDLTPDANVPTTATPSIVASRQVPAPLAKPLNLQVASIQIPDADASSADSQIEQGDADGPSVPEAAAPKQWAIQIGAFADRNTALAQLGKYAERAMDVLGQAKRLVVAATSGNGHTLYRARFGLFAEAEARSLCQHMTSQGHTCFAIYQGS